MSNTDLLVEIHGLLSRHFGAYKAKRIGKADKQTIRGITQQTALGVIEWTPVRWCSRDQNGDAVSFCLSDHGFRAIWNGLDLELNWMICEDEAEASDWNYGAFEGEPWFMTGRNHKPGELWSYLKIGDRTISGPLVSVLLLVIFGRMIEDLWEWEADHWWPYKNDDEWSVNDPDRA